MPPLKTSPFLRINCAHLFSGTVSQGVPTILLPLGLVLLATIIREVRQGRVQQLLLPLQHRSLTALGL
jgi:hypothetical protein